MSNQISIERTEFRSWSNGKLETSYGYRIYDNYDKSYNNTFASPDAADDEGKLPDEDLTLLKIVARDSINDEAIAALLSHVTENQIGVTIDGVFYEWDEIKKIVEADPTEFS